MTGRTLARQFVPCYYHQSFTVGLISGPRLRVFEQSSSGSAICFNLPVQAGRAQQFLSTSRCNFPPLNPRPHVLAVGAGFLAFASVPLHTYMRGRPEPKSRKSGNHHVRRRNKAAHLRGLIQVGVNAAGSSKKETLRNVRVSTRSGPVRPGSSPIRAT